MAAKTPDSVTKESAGSLVMHIAKFSTNTVDDADTWVSGIQGIVGYWGTLTDNPTTTGTGEGIDIALSTASTGTFKFNTGENAVTAMIYVLSKS